MLIMFEWSFFQVEVNWQNYVTLAHSPEIRGVCMMKWPSEVFKLCQDFRNICSLINSLDKWMVYVNCKNMVKFESLQWNISSSIKLYFPERGYNWKLISLGLTYKYCLPLASHFTNRPLLKWTPWQQLDYNCDFCFQGLFFGAT